MSSNQIIIRSSPFLFIKRFILIEFFFALLPFLAGFIFNLLFGGVADTYEQLPFARSISIEFFLVLIGTSLQVIIVILVFMSWYFPVYVVDRHQITHQRGNVAGNRMLVNTPAINQVAVKQGRLGRNLNYGSLHITASNSPEKAHLKDIPEPFDYALKIEDMIDYDLLQSEEPAPESPVQLITGGERQHVEFKSSLAWDYHQQRANKALHQPVMKTLAAFMNSSGGYLLIGVADDGQVLGLDPDLQTLRRPTLDAFETAFNMAFNKMIGVEFREFVDVAFPELDEKPICILRVHPSNQPVYLLEKGNEKFYIRAGNASQSMTISQANRYIRRRFSDQ